MQVDKAGAHAGSPAAVPRPGARLPPAPRGGVHAFHDTSLGQSRFLCLNYTFAPGFKWG